MRLLFVTHFDPAPVGHGGVHRTFQIYHALEEFAGKGNVTIVKVWLQWWKHREPSAAPIPVQNKLAGKFQRNKHALTNPALYARPVRRAARKLQERWQQLGANLNGYAENPYKFLAQTDYTTHTCKNPAFLADYQKILHEVQPSACVLEHTTFADLVPLHRARNIPTLCCPQNLEAFDLMPAPSKYARHATAIDFANELNALEQCDARLFISQVEAALVTGMGIPAHYFPYAPVGEIRQTQLAIRAARAQQEQERGLFVMVGSAEHGTTREAFQWFLQHARAHGVPSNTRIVIGGSGTRELLSENDSVPGVEIRGWLEQTELNELLLRAQAMLIPQQRGFGALTRLSEFACAGIPVIVSPHPTNAQEPPPGTLVAGDDWNEWVIGMESMMSHPPTISMDAYTAWEARQPRPLNAVIESLLHVD